MTVNQHVFPKASLERFVNASGKVEVCRQGNRFLVNPEDPTFCARRVWDQGSEEAYLSWEASFQELAERIVANPNACLSPFDNDVASNFFALVCARTIARRNPIPDQELQGATPVSIFDKDTVERLEKAGYVTLNQVGEVPGRMLAGPRIQVQIDSIKRQIESFTWKVVQSSSLDFLVSDSIDRVPVIPINSQLMLCSDRDGILSKEDVEAHNDNVRSEHDLYYFGVDLNKC